jgi:hypothetical protein
MVAPRGVKWASRVDPVVGSVAESFKMLVVEGDID